jgi:hypothetical protein
VKYHLKATRGSPEPGGLQLSAAVEIELEDTTCTVERSHELREQMLIVTSALANALNLQFPAATRGEPAELVDDDGEDGYRSAAPPHSDDDVPFDEFAGQSPHDHGPPPARHVNRLPPAAASAGPAIPPAPVRPQQPQKQRGSIIDKPPRNAGQFLGWLKNRPEHKKYAAEVGKSWGYGTWIKEWDDDQAVAVYNEVSRKFSANGLSANGVHS